MEVPSAHHRAMTRQEKSETISSGIEVVEESHVAAEKMPDAHQQAVVGGV